MPEFNIIETRTVVQERTSLVEAASEDDIWIHDRYAEITNLSDWETVASDEAVTDVRVPL